MTFHDYSLVTCVRMSTLNPGSAKPKKHLNPIKAGKQTVLEYAANSTIAGISYIFDGTLLILERLLWLLVFGVLVILSVKWSLDAYNQWQESPVLTSVKTTGLPLKEIDYPAITICSQGLVQDVINNAIKKQLIDYIKETYNKDYDALTAAEKEQLEQSYNTALYPGSETSITSMVNVLTAPEPTKTVEAQVLTNPEAACVEVSSDCASPWMLPTYMNTSYFVDFDCVANFGMGKLSENKCEENGGELISFGEADHYSYSPNGKDADALWGSIYEPSGEFHSINSDYFWFGAEIDVGKAITTLGIDLINDPYYYGKMYSGNTLSYVNMTGIDNTYCPRFRINSTYTFYFEVDFVKCNGDDQAHFLCRKVPNDCSELSGTGGGTQAAGRKKRQAALEEASLDKVFVKEKKQKYDKIAKRSQQSASENFKKMNLEKSYKSLFEILWYSQLPCYDVSGVTSTEANKYGMLKACIWKGQTLPCSELFTTFPTDQGMCCTFNMKKAEEMFESSQYQTMIKFMQDRDKNLSFVDEKLPKGKWKNDPLPLSGRKKGLKLVLDAHSDYLSGGTVPEDFDGFYAIIDANNQFPTVTRNTVLIRPGHNNLVSMGATKVSADSQIKGVDRAKRYCLFEDEMVMTFHKKYSQANCLMECGIEYAASAMNITPPCIPWYFPMNESMNTRICDPWEARKFRNLMENIPDGQCDKCLPDCSTTLYHASVTAAPFRRCDYKNLGISYLCNFEEKIDPPIWGQQVLDQYFNDLNVDDSSLLPDYIRSGVKTQHRRYADENIAAGNPVFQATNTKSPSYDAYQRDIAMVTFFFESTTVFEYTREQRMTLIQYISQVGGLMGLCIGFSFISAAELIYWFTIRYFRNM